MRAYHATSAQHARLIREVGFDLNVQRDHDPGDFGWGFYSTRYLPRAQGRGGEILRVRMLIENPLVFNSLSEAYQWLEIIGKRMGGTIHGSHENRVVAASKVADYVLGLGYDGIVVNERKIKGYEVVSYRGMVLEHGWVDHLLQEFKLNFFKLLHLIRRKR